MLVSLSVPLDLLKLCQSLRKSNCMPLTELLESRKARLEEFEVEMEFGIERESGPYYYNI